MHDIRAIRENPEAYDTNWARRGLGPQTPEILRLDAAARAATAALQELQAERNAKSAEIGRIKAAGGDAAPLMEEVAALKARMEAKDENAEKLQKLLEGLPNLLDDAVPDGADEADNKEVYQWGTAGREGPDHVEIGERLGLMDFEGAARMSGARFVVLKGPLARLERALAALMLDMATAEHGYTEVSPPLLVRDEAMFGTGQLPKFYEEQFLSGSIGGRGALLEKALEPLDSKYESYKGSKKPSEVLKEVLDSADTEEDYWLIPTAEVPLTNLVREAITDEEALPLRFTAHTPCFRSEAGSAGKDTRGMLRQHQFYKVEMVSITTPEESTAEHERMRGCAEAVLRRLGLPFRTVVLCAGDTGFGSRKTYDLEVWLPGQGRYREISSVSNCGDFQARRMNARCRAKGEKKTRFLHTLNGSGVAVGRALIAVLENGWDGEKVILPPALVPYMGGATHIGP